MVDVQTLENINLIITDGNSYLIDRNGVDAIVKSAMQTFGGEFLIADPIDRIIKVYYHLTTTQFFSDGNKRTAEVSMFVNFKSLGYELKIKDTVLGKLTLDIANHRVSEEDANKIIRSYLNF